MVVYIALISGVTKVPPSTSSWGEIGDIFELLSLIKGSS